MSTDVLADLARLRPSDLDLEQRWPSDERAQLLDRVLHAAPEPGTRLRHLPVRRRWVAVAGVAAAAVLVVPAVLPAGAPGAADPAAAAVLQELAVTAAAAPVDQLRPGQFVHSVSENHQYGTVWVPGRDERQPEDFRTHIDSWTSSDRRVVAQVSGTHADGQHYTETGAYPATDRPDPRTLPTEPDALEHYLRAHASGGDSQDDAVFQDLGELLQQGVAPAAFRAAGFAVLERLPGITVGPMTRDELGRPVRELDFRRDEGHPENVDGLLFDTRTALVVGGRSSGGGESFTSTTTVMEVVDAVPPAVLRVAVQAPAAGAGGAGG